MMNRLVVPSTKRLHFVCDKVDYDPLFKDLVYTGIPRHELQAIFDLPDEERAASIQAGIELLSREIRFIQEHIVPKEADPNIHVAIYGENESGAPVGRVVLNYLTTPHPSIDIRILPEKQHQGYGCEMLSAVVDAAFDQYGMDHLEYDVLFGNVPSRSLIRKLNGTLTYGDDMGEMYALYPTDRRPSA